MEQIAQEAVERAAKAFSIEGEYLDGAGYGSGHINDTFLVNFKMPGGKKKHFVLQRMNRNIFTNPEELMENITKVTAYLREKILAKGGDPERETLNVVPSGDGKSYYLDPSGEYWRMYLFIERSISRDQVETPEEFYESGYAFGYFQQMLSEYPAKTLHETIPGFHDTKKRFNTFLKAVAEDRMGRACQVEKEIAFVKDRESLAGLLGSKVASGELPLRVTHNDTKLNNIMLDEETKKGICIIDLDTVMPGLSVNDFGDAIRFGASTAAEDERDLSKVSCDMELFETYTKGFLEGCGGSLTREEILMLPVGAKTMTFECGMRFLTDYLEGDTYFKIHRENHNLDRARTQFQLVADMEQKWDTMMRIVEGFLS